MKGKYKKRTKHNLSHVNKMSGNLGELIPIAWFDALPCDVIGMKTSALVRLAPLARPLMHKINVKIHHWAVPKRLVWDQDGSSFEDFITGGSDGNDATTHPYKDLSAVTTNRGDLLNYLGVRNGYQPSDYNILYARAYQLIRNEAYRNIDVQTENTISTNAGADTTTNTTLQRVTWDKDYFTTSDRDWETVNSVCRSMSL